MVATAQRTNTKYTVAPDPGTGLINPVTVSEMVAAYNKAIRLLEDGYQALRDAQDVMTGGFGKDNRFSVTDRDSIDNAHVTTIKRKIHRQVWRAILDKMDVWKVLSLKRADELRDRLEKGELPPVTEEEIFTMFEAMSQNAPDFAKEFALEVYEWLTPGNKSNSRWEAEYVTNKRNARDELGKKVILGWMIENQSAWSSQPFSTNYRNHDKLAALDRLFCLLDGKPAPEVNTYQSPLVAAINTVDSGGYGETEYFKFRACQNGNLHIEFKRLDLVQKLNEIAGNPTALRQKKHKTQRGDHTEVNVPNSPEKEEERREEAFYHTPAAVAARMLKLVPPPTTLDQAKMRILEPSAGEGHIADCLVAAGVNKKQITCIEKNYDRVGVLLRKGYRVWDIDFLKWDKGGWNYIYMNPPFNQGQSRLHVMHAYKLLTPGGWLCAVMSEGDFTSTESSAVYFQNWLKNVNGKNEPLPKYSFRDAGTTWDTRLVWIQKGANV